MKKIKVFITAYIILILCLFFYSYTQVDLDLTFSRVPLLHTIIKAFQYIGYFQRPLSTLFFSLIVILLFVFYLLFLRLVKKQMISRNQTWFVIIITAIVLLFSYNAFSYDLFNYIFDAKIFTYYHQNPYEHKALDYMHDPMLTFMRWTHRTYPYGPVWLALTIPLSYLGFQLFIPTFILFKMLAVLSYLGSSYFLEKIARKCNPKMSMSALVFFALNPLVIIESLVSAHIDIVMIFLFLWSFYLLVEYKYVRATILFLLSVGIKFATGFLLPIYIYLFTIRKKITKKFHVVLLISILLMIIAVGLETQRTTYQSWYFLIVLPFCSLSDKSYVRYPAIIFSFCSLFIYAPYLYFGDYMRPVPALMVWIIANGALCSVASIILILFRQKAKFKV